MFFPLDVKHCHVAFEFLGTLFSPKQLKSGNPEISPGGVQNEKIENP